MVPLIITLLLWEFVVTTMVIFFSADIARLLQYFNNISDRFRNILAILQYVQGILLQYFLNISVLCGYLICAMNGNVMNVMTGINC